MSPPEEHSRKVKEDDTGGGVVGRKGKFDGTQNSSSSGDSSSKIPPKLVVSDMHTEKAEVAQDIVQVAQSDEDVDKGQDDSNADSEIRQEQRNKLETILRAFFPKSFRQYQVHYFTKFKMKHFIQKLATHQ